MENRRSKQTEGKKKHTAHDGSVFQHCVHPEEHKTQMRGFWSSSKLNPATVIQSSNTPNPSTPLLAGNLSWLSLSQIYSLLLLLPCICISVSTADALGYVCYFFLCYLFKCLSQFLRNPKPFCGALGFFPPPCFPSSSSLCLSVSGVLGAKINTFSAFVHNFRGALEYLLSVHAKNTEAGDELQKPNWPLLIQC